MTMNRLIKCTYNYLTFRSHSTLRSVMLPSIVPSGYQNDWRMLDSPHVYSSINPST